VVAGLQTLEDLNVIYGGCAESDPHTRGVAAIGFHFKEGSLAVLFG
jgi:hypothetical protein